MAYSIQCDGRKVTYEVDRGDTLPLHWKVQQPDGTFASLTHPNTFTIRPFGSDYDATPLVTVPLTEAGDYAVGEWDSGELAKGRYDCAYYDPVLDVSLRGLLKVK